MKFRIYPACISWYSVWNFKIEPFHNKMAAFYVNLFESVSSGQRTVCTDSEKKYSTTHYIFNIGSKLLWYWIEVALPSFVCPGMFIHGAHPFAHNVCTLFFTSTNENPWCKDCVLLQTFGLHCRRMTFLHLVESVLWSQDCFLDTVYCYIPSLSSRTFDIDSHVWNIIQTQNP